MAVQRSPKPLMRVRFLSPLPKKIQKKIQIIYTIWVFFILYQAFLTYIIKRNFIYFDITIKEQKHLLCSQSEHIYRNRGKLFFLS